MIPYTSDERADAATKNPNLKLLFRLSKFYILDDGETNHSVYDFLTVIDLVRNQDADELEWYVPSGIAISELERIRNVIKQFLEAPIDLDGKKASQLLGKKRGRRRHRSPSPVSDNDDGDDGDGPRRKKKEKKKKEKEQYKSAQFIEDSDEEYGGMDAFLEKEKVQREKASLAAAGARPPTMKATGTKKKRRRKAEGKKPPISKKLKEDASSPMSGGMDNIESNESDVEVNETTMPMTRPRPRPLTKRRVSSPPPSSEPDERISSPLSDAVKPSLRSKRLILSDDDE